MSDQTFSPSQALDSFHFTEGKHPWHLTHFPQKTEDAVIVYCFFTLLAMALCTAFRPWQAQVTPEEAPSDDPAQPAQVPLEITLLGGEDTAAGDGGSTPSAFF